jgi:hypothetical protein
MAVLWRSPLGGMSGMPLRNQSCRCQKNYQEPLADKIIVVLCNGESDSIIVFVMHDKQSFSDLVFLYQSLEMKVQGKKVRKRF